MRGLNVASFGQSVTADVYARGAALSHTSVRVVAEAFFEIVGSRLLRLN
jgi:hypothetical protein